MSLDVRVYETATDFLRRAEDHLSAAPAENNLILSVARKAEEEESGPEAPFFATVERAGEVVGAAFRTPPHKLGVTRMPVEAAPLVAAAAARRYRTLPAVLGPADVAEAVARAWVAGNGGRWRRGMVQRLYRLDAVAEFRQAPGGLRVAGVHDVGLAVEWGHGFVRDMGTGFHAPPEEAVRRWVETGALCLWEDAGEPVSMGVGVGRVAGGARVGYVYTPPHFRGRGYATALVAEMSRLLLESGLSFCVLYTDLGNPVSNRIYQRVGYRPLTDVVDVELEPGHPS